jgi:hypothetical protein
VEPASSAASFSTFSVFFALVNAIRNLAFSC